MTLPIWAFILSLIFAAFLGALVLWIALVTAKHEIEKEEEENYKNIV